MNLSSAITIVFATLHALSQFYRMLRKNLGNVLSHVAIKFHRMLRKESGPNFCRTSPSKFFPHVAQKSERTFL